MYLIVKHDFDILENHNSEYTTIIGYVENELYADVWIGSRHDKQYRGWNGQMYPYYTKHKIKRIYI